MIANKKPWGYECLAFQNENVAVWHLFVDPGQETSLHCHPNKKTGLVVLDGAAKISFLSGEQNIVCGEKILIRQGVFHQTKNPLRTQLQLFEIETPVQKNDIVRIQDRYGRAKLPLGNEPTMEISISYPWNWHIANEPVLIGNKFVEMINIDYYSHKVIRYAQSNALFMITQGGLTENNYNVLGPGDVINLPNFEKLLRSFHLQENTQAIVIY